MQSCAETKPRREVIHLWPCYLSPAATATLQQVVDVNGNVVLGNAFHGSPVLYQVAGLPNTLTDAQCHGPQLEIWAMRGAIISRDIVTRIIDSDTPDAPEDDKQLRKDRRKHVNKLVRRRQNYRGGNMLGLVPGFVNKDQTLRSPHESINGRPDHAGMSLHECSLYISTANINLRLPLGKLIWPEWS